MFVVYYDIGCDIIFLCIVYLIYFVFIVFLYIDDWIWFKILIVVIKENICDFGYYWGGCLVVEKIGKLIMNLLVIIDLK